MHDLNTKYTATLAPLRRRPPSGPRIFLRHALCPALPGNDETKDNMSPFRRHAPIRLSSLFLRPPSLAPFPQALFR